MDMRIGTDIIRHERIAADLENIGESAFARYTFSAAELAESQQAAEPITYLAGRFCAKEAVIKTLQGELDSVRFNEIETLRGDGGLPVTRLTGDAAKGMEARGRSWDFSTSISHEEGVSIACVLASFDDLAV